jgi:acyl-CoA synthetase (AMP-forming)/AMP-acid ligase II
MTEMKMLDERFSTSAAIPGTMMDVDLTIAWIFEHVLRNNGSRTVVSRLDDGTTFRYTYADFGKRVAQLAHALVELGIGPGDRVASFGWNTHRHLELYYAVPMIGAVLHTVNIRLFPEQVCWVFDHAGDKLAFVDASLAPAVANAMATRPEMKLPFVVMGQKPLRGRSSTSGRRRSSAIPQLPQAIPRASSSPTGRRFCTRSEPDSRKRSRSRKTIRSSPSCRCSTSTLGARRISCRWSAATSYCPARSSIPRASSNSCARKA